MKITFLFAVSLRGENVFFILTVRIPQIIRIFVVVLDNLFDYQLFVENSHENGQRIRKCGTVW